MPWLRSASSAYQRPQQLRALFHSSTGLHHFSRIPGLPRLNSLQQSTTSIFHHSLGSSHSLLSLLRIGRCNTDSGFSITVILTGRYFSSLRSHMRAPVPLGNQLSLPLLLLGNLDILCSLCLV